MTERPDTPVDLRERCLGVAIQRTDAKTAEQFRAAIDIARDLYVFCVGDDAAKSAAGASTREGEGSGGPNVVMATTAPGLSSLAADTAQESEPPPAIPNAGAGPADRVGQRESVNASGAGAPRKGIRASSDGRHPAASPARYGAGNPKVTPAMLADMRRRYEAGEAVPSIARALGLSAPTVSKRQKAGGWARRVEPAAKPAASAPVVARAVLRDAVRAMETAAIPALSAADADIVRLWRRGDDFSAICKALGTTQPRLSADIERLGLANDPTRLKNRARPSRSDDDAA